MVLEGLFLLLFIPVAAAAVSAAAAAAAASGPRARCMHAALGGFFI